jgi:flavodoxin I
MAKVGLFYGSTTGNTEMAAERIQEEFNNATPDMVELFNVVDTSVDSMQDFDALILGASTWDIGEMQYDWQDVMDDLDGLDLNGKKVAIFGLGDQIGYGDTFQDAIGILGKKMRECGAQLIGYTSVEGFEFENSAGIENGHFMGLSLDEDNQADLTDQRIVDWVKQLRKELDQ